MICQLQVRDTLKQLESFMKTIGYKFDGEEEKKEAGGAGAAAAAAEVDVFAGK